MPTTTAVLGGLLQPLASSLRMRRRAPSRVLQVSASYSNDQRERLGACQLNAYFSLLPALFRFSEAKSTLRWVALLLRLGLFKSRAGFLYQARFEKLN
jgi:hypothetical protein